MVITIGVKYHHGTKLIKAIPIPGSKGEEDINGKFETSDSKVSMMDNSIS